MNNNLNYPPNVPQPLRNNSSQGTSQQFQQPVHSQESDEFDEKRLRRKNFTQFILNILYGSLVVSALIGIAAIVFGNDEYGSKAIGTIFLLIVIDLILLLALLPKNPLFRYSIWILSILAFAFTTLGIWLPKHPIVYSDIYPYEMIPQERTIGVICQGIGVSFWLLLATVILLSFVSLAEPLIEKTGKRGMFFYWSLITIAITGTLPIAIAYPMTISTNIEPSFALKIYASAFILSLTIVLILTIAIIAQNIIEIREKRSNHSKNLNNPTFLSSPYGSSNIQPPSPASQTTPHPPRNYKESQSNDPQ